MKYVIMETEIGSTVFLFGEDASYLEVTEALPGEPIATGRCDLVPIKNPIPGEPEYSVSVHGYTKDLDFVSSSEIELIIARSFVFRAEKENGE